ncbi:DUF1604-domain-containing protein [Auriscalpium vulgare]|uniref:DUF1604-domain-containing protein n=1 Tax=Auriscalpium vulgare TaxID=40419 RepID=A0ACB8RK74_9AGAM|nr:DUF1604-domain-containing protein [Auriscalpium vulgare]
MALRLRRAVSLARRSGRCRYSTQAEVSTSTLPKPRIDYRDISENVTQTDLWKQYVCIPVTLAYSTMRLVDSCLQVPDGQGRRRLHGAFTGGISAGYFNNVGSKEEWTPSTCKSSRGERNKAANTRPKYFMDGEDLAEFRETRLMGCISNSATFSAACRPSSLRAWPPTRRKSAPRTSLHSALNNAEIHGSIASVFERALLPPPDDSPGVRLLKKMGWRQGQRVGPRVSWRRRKIQNLLATAKTLNNVDVDVLNEDEEAKKHMYPPRDTVVVGMCRSGGQRGPWAGCRIVGVEACFDFGLGALREADDDDLDVYDASSHKD